MKHVKCVVVGDKDAGKTHLLISFTTNAYPGEYIPTVYDQYSANVIAEGCPPCNLQLWDTASDQDYAKLRPLSYSQTDVFLICFSLVRPKSLEHAETIWIKEIREHCPDAPFILVGTELDKRDDFEANADEFRSQGMEPISKEKGQEVADRINANCYIEVSARKAINLTELFDNAVRFAFNASQKESKNTKAENTEGGCCKIF